MSRAQHGGDAAAIANRLGLDASRPVELDFSVNLNPEGPPAALQRVLMQGAEVATCYPDEFAHSNVLFQIP